MRALIIATAAAALLAGCDSKVKQQQPPEIPEAEPGNEASTDMAPEPEKTIAPEEDTGGESEAELRARCCKVCADAATDHESGDPPGALSCAKIAGGESACVLFFDNNPMTGSEAQSCVEETGGAGEDGEEAGEDTASEADTAAEG